MRNYAELVEKVLTSGYQMEGRNGKTVALFGKQLTFHLGAGFPVVTGRQMFFKGVLGELAAFLAGPTHVNHFKSQGCHYWDKFADDDGKLRLAYGNSWRDFHGTDQMKNLIDGLRADPYSRRHIITAWDPSGLDELSLMCCHYSYQWNVNTYGELEMIWIQRSVDLMLGLPSDIILAGALNMLVAQTVGLKPGKIVLQLGNCHVYEEHWEVAREYLKQPYKSLPKAKLDPKATVDNFLPEMLTFEGYTHGPKLSFELKT